MSRAPIRNARGAEAPAGAFLCEHCKTTVPAAAPGTAHRNHCPRCLWSLHVDLRTGDRRSGCRGLMEPVAVAARRDGEWALLHRCRDCGMLRLNRIAGDDHPLPLVSLAVRPLGSFPFPLEHLTARLHDGEGGRP
jgi:hypothetical protein